MDTSQATEEVRQEFADALDSDIEKWKTAIKKSIDIYEKKENEQ